MTNDSTTNKTGLTPDEINLHQIDDKVFRATMQNKPAFLLLLEQFVPIELTQHIDFESLELDNTEYVMAQLKKLQSDVVWQGQFKGKALKIIVLLEHKKSFDREIFIQLLLYLCCIWLVDLHGNKPFSCILPIVVHQGAGGKVWETRDFHHFFAHVPPEFLVHIPNYRFLLTNVQREPPTKILGLPEDNLLRALFLMFQCNEDEEKIKQYFAEIFKFYQNQPHLQLVLQTYLLYIMASFNMTIEQILALMDSISPQSKKEIMTTYEVLVSKGKILGREEGLKLRDLQLIWRSHVRKSAISEVAAFLEIAPSMVNKWLKRFVWMQEGEAEGLTPVEIMLKVNDLAAEPAVTELEVVTLLAFFKEQPAPKTKKKRVKKD
jgi:Putative transposase, YhgA-like